MLNIIETELSGVKIIEPEVFGDSRGWFMESWSQHKFEAGLIYIDFVQDNHSFSAQKGTFRGLHYQLNPMAQAKLVRCTRGELLDIAVDIRKGSPQFGKWTSVILSADNKRQLLIPRGFAHGFLTLTDNVEVQYKADNYYAPKCDGNILWSDPQIGLQLPFEPTILSDKDKNAPTLQERMDRDEINFVFEQRGALL